MSKKIVLVDTPSIEANLEVWQEFVKKLEGMQLEYDVESSLAYAQGVINQHQRALFDAWSDSPDSEVHANRRGAYRKIWQTALESQPHAKVVEPELFDATLFNAWFDSEPQFHDDWFVVWQAALAAQN